MAAPRRNQDAIETALVRNMRDVTATGTQTKRSAVRLAIVQAMRDGDLQHDDFLPPEKRLAEILGVSLGTVQAALLQLQQRGEVVRRSGYGSRIVLSERFASSVWHFRFVDRADGKRLTFSDEDLAIDTLDDPGPWSAFLCGEADGNGETFVRITRRMRMSNGASCAAQMYLRDKAAPRLKRIDPSELKSVNIRYYLNDKFGLATASAATVVQSTRLDAPLAGLLGVKPGTHVLELHASAVAHDETPVYFQRIFVPADSCAIAF